MSENSSIDDDVEFSGEADKTVEVHLPAHKVNEILCLLEVPMPDANDLDKVLIHIKHELGFRAALSERVNDPALTK